MTRPAALVLLVLAQCITVQSQHSEHGTSGDTTAIMVPWLHFTPGDTVLFQDWVPRKKGPIFGACLALFMLAILDRWLAALRRFMEAWWSEQARIIVSRRFVQIDEQSRSEEEKGGASTEVRSASGSRRVPPLSRNRIPPFIASHDFARGAFVVFQTAITYALMLTVMTFNAGFILAILLGLGTGEVLFGRLAFISTSHVEH